MYGIKVLHQLYWVNEVTVRCVRHVNNDSPATEHDKLYHANKLSERACFKLVFV